ncbi:MAG TPA: transporter [Ramlibacter sp.]|nr:transporter [Ramlibacter sp.]
MSPSISRVAAFAFAVACTQTHASCGSAFCSLLTDWSSGAAGLGASDFVDLRYESIDQSQPRSGSQKVAVGAIPRHHDEVSTRNRNLVANYTHNFANEWGVSITAPLAARDHFHIHNHRGARIDERWTFREAGDVSVIARYRVPAAADAAPSAGAAGFLFGVKLPTGRTSIRNGAGDLAERSLQPGSGSVDAIVGAFYQKELGASSSWFTQATLRHAIRGRDFKPGAQLAADIGYAHSVTDRLSVALQLNAVLKRRDSGPLGEPADSGGRFLFLSPGVSYAVGESLRVYAVYQQPIYQYVNGVQLTAKNAVVVGINGRF